MGAWVKIRQGKAVQVHKTFNQLVSLFALFQLSQIIMLCARSAVAVRPRASSARAAPARSLRVVVRSTPADIEKETSKALKNADEVCKTGTTEVSIWGSGRRHVLRYARLWCDYACLHLRQHTIHHVPRALFLIPVWWVQVKWPTMVDMSYVSFSGACSLVLIGS